MNSQNRGGGGSGKLKGDPETLGGATPRYRRRIPLHFSVSEDQGTIQLTSKGRPHQ
jgi:hypothetical protein